MQQALAALRFEPALPPWLLAALAILGAAVVAAGFFARARGSVLRLCAFAVLAAWLANPTLVRETRQGLTDIALLVIDRSASMQVGERQALAAHAEADLRAQARQLPGLELRTVSVQESGHDGTRLWAATRSALADIPAARLAGIIAITDGQIHDLPGVAPLAPLHALIPAAGEEWDRRVRVIEAPGYGIVGHALDLRVVVEDLGPGQHGAANLVVQQDGQPAETRQVVPGAVQTLSVQIARAGPMVIKLSTDPAPGEVSPLNNQAVVQITGVRDRLRVLLVSGEPNQGERTWRRLLKSDPAVDLVHFTILRPPEKDDTTPLNELALIAFPTRELFQEKLSGFDLIILDRFTDRGILPHLYLRNIADYVRRGGALLLTVGPEFASPASLDQTPLSAVLPAHAPMSADGVTSERFVPTVTGLGQRHPVTEGLPGGDSDPPGWGPWYRAVVAEDVQGQVLMTGPERQPLLILNHVEQGRTALLMSDQIWLWSHGHGGGGPQAELLRRVAHWLMKEPDLDEERLSARIEPGVPGTAVGPSQGGQSGSRLVVERRSAAGRAEGSVKLTPPSGQERPLALPPSGPGRASARLEGAAPGVWQVEDGTHVAFAVIGQDNPQEFADLRATGGKLRALVRQSDGGTAFLGAGTPQLRRVGQEGDAAGAGWIGLRQRGAHLVTGVITSPLLPPWAALPLLLGLVVAAWRREAS